MGNEVYAETMGFFHRASSGQGNAPADFCNSPPTPPAGPLPVPYVNVMIANDLTKGTTTVTIQGAPTAIENSSEVNPSSGDEGGTVGGGVISFKTKGVAQFTLWSFVVKAEGKGICCHGHMVQQNMNGTVPNSIDPAALVNFAIALAMAGVLGKPCPEWDESNRPAISDPQQKAVDNKTCWECEGQIAQGQTPKVPGGKWLAEADYATYHKGTVAGRDRNAMTADHQPPLSTAWEMGGCHIPPVGDNKGFKELFSSPKMVKPHCARHSNSQGPTAGRFMRSIRSLRGG